MRKNNVERSRGGMFGVTNFKMKYICERKTEIKIKAMENKQKSSNEAHSEPLQQCSVSRSVTILLFEKYSSITGEFLLAKVPGFEGGYCIWFDRLASKYKVSDLKRNHHLFDKIDEAKVWVQDDFNKKVDLLFEDVRFSSWKKNQDFNDKISNETAFDIWNALDERSK